MPSSTEIGRMVIRLVGDATQYRATLAGSAAQTVNYSKTVTTAAASSQTAMVQSQVAISNSLMILNMNMREVIRLLNVQNGLMARSSATTTQASISVTQYNALLKAQSINNAKTAATTA